MYVNYFLIELENGFAFRHTELGILNSQPSPGLEWELGVLVCTSLKSSVLEDTFGSQQLDEIKSPECE